MGIKNFLFKAMLFVGCLGLSLTSCNKDDDNSGNGNDENEEKPNNNNGNNDSQPNDDNVITNLKLSVSGNIGGHVYVDLGLKSGTLWATWNVGASKPEEFGDYFAWGETETKERFSDSTYKWRIYDSIYDNWRDMYDDELVSQGVMESLGRIGRYRLTPEYDVARAKWGGDWRMPTEDEIRELIPLRCMDATINGVDGWVVYGPNGNTLFFPAAQYRYYFDLLGTNLFDSDCGDGGYYSSDLNGDPYYLRFRTNLGSDVASSSGAQSWGRSIRPVLSSK